MKKGVMRPGHVQLRVLDMGKALEHYIELLGLIEMDRDDQGRVYLKAWSEVDKFSVVLREADEPGMDFMGFKVVDEVSLQQLEQDLQAHGCSVEQVPAGSSIVAVGVCASKPPQGITSSCMLTRNTLANGV